MLKPSPLSCHINPVQGHFYYHNLDFIFVEKSEFLGAIAAWTHSFMAIIASLL